MAEEGLQIVRLKDDFYRDGFQKALVAFCIIVAAILSLICTSLYLYLSKPKPITFNTGKEWRIIPPIPVDQPFKTTPKALQWISTTLSSIFNFDFIHYSKELNNNKRYFTSNGWNNYLEIINLYTNTNNIQHNKLFVRGTADGAPITQRPEGILKTGAFAGRYSWLVRMPIILNFYGSNTQYKQILTIEVLLVRVPTEDNIDGIAIENINLVHVERTS